MYNNLPAIFNSASKSFRIYHLKQSHFFTRLKCIKLYVFRRRRVCRKMQFNVTKKKKLTTSLRYILTAVLLVAVVAAVVLMVAFQFRIDALLPVQAPELVQRTTNVHRRPAVLLVLVVPAVEVTVAPSGLGQTRTGAGTVHLAPEVLGLAFSVRWKHAKQHRISVWSFECKKCPVDNQNIV